MKEAPTTISFEELYSDKSGVEFGVSYHKRREDNEIQFERIDSVTFPIDRLDWLIDRLTQIRAELKP